MLGILTLCAAPAAGAATSAHCDATPFTLRKNAAPAQAIGTAEPNPKPAPVKEAAKKPIAKPQGANRLLASCKGGKPKKSG